MRQIISSMRMLLVSAMMLLALGAQAQQQKQTREMPLGKYPGKVNIFGVSTAFGDSVVYITSVCQVDSIALQKKTKFLPFRSEFGMQLREYVEGTLQQKRQTVCVYFDKDSHKLNRTYNKLVKRYQDDANVQVIIVEDSKFKFQHPVDLMTVVDENEE